MLSFEQKKLFLIQYLSEKQENYFDTLRSDFLFQIEIEEIELSFLNNLHSEEKITHWVEKILSVYYLKCENELSLKEFLYEESF